MARDIEIAIMENWTMAELNSTYRNTTKWDFVEDTECGFILDVFVLTFLCFVGFIGNSLTIAVLRRDRDPKRLQTTNWLLEMLAAVDSIFLAFVFILFPMRNIAMSYDTLAELVTKFNYLRKYLFFCTRIARTMSIWTVVFVTVDRYLAICKPGHTKWRSLRRMKIAVIVLFILAVIYRFPEFVGLDARITKDCNDGGLEQRDCHEWLCYYYIYKVVCPLIFLSGGPFAILVLLNVRICMAIKALNKRRSEMTRAATEEKTVSIMVIVVVIVFLICLLPINIVLLLIQAMVLSGDVIDCSLAISNALLVLNSSINFLLYCLIWGKFKGIFVRMMTCRKENTSSENQTRSDLLSVSRTTV